MTNYRSFAAIGAAVLLCGCLTACNTVNDISLTKEELLQIISNPSSQGNSIGKNDQNMAAELPSGPAEDAALRYKAEQILKKFLDRNEKNGKNYILSSTEWTELKRILDMEFDNTLGACEETDGRAVLTTGSYDDRLAELGRHTGFGSASRTVDGVLYTVIVFRTRS